ncbi:hypothetical protein [Micromonospora parva]|uniref:hypothetical protein n=1 Tax=Micromonospora parva TaxID=1464048 RepID=UPI00364ECCEF
MSVTNTAVLPVGEETVNRLTGLLDAERTRRGGHARTRSLTCRDQAILTQHRFYDGTRITQLGAGNRTSVSTGYDYRHEAIDVLAAQHMSSSTAR